MGDPSGVARFLLNGQKVKLTRIEKSPYPAYSFSHTLPLQEQKIGTLRYHLEDSLKNIASGIIPINVTSENFGVITR
ncbi:MAG: hypothetical protein ACMUJM_07345 [bacterium]